MKLYSLWVDAEAALLLEELLWPYKHIEDERPEEPVDPHDRPVVRLDSVSESFGRVQVPDDVTFEIRYGEILGGIDRGGTGNSTLNRRLNGQEKPGRCRIESLSRDVAPLDERALRAVRRRIGMIFRHFNPSSTERWRRTWRIR